MNTWMRYCYTGSTMLLHQYVRYYIQGVRSDGYLFTAGLDFVQGTMESPAIETALLAQLNYFLTSTMVVQNVGASAFQGQDGWIEAA